MAATAGNKLAGKFCGTDHRRALRKEPKVLAGKLDSINLIESNGFPSFEIGVLSLGAVLQIAGGCSGRGIER